MAKSIFVHATADDRSRLKLARMASCELLAITEVLDLLINREELETVDSIWPGIRLRLTALSSVVMSAVDDGLEPTEDLARAMFDGRCVNFDAASWLGATKEVAHG